MICNYLRDSKTFKLIMKLSHVIMYRFLKCKTKIVVMNV